ncbi:integrase, catalytic region, zinc finger, CCHC-type containing protein [Tanacetum coccineum]
MCMFSHTVSTTEPNTIKEAMADSARIEAMQEELHQFDRLQVWELVDKPFDGFVDPDHPEKVYRLRKALYGLKQAPIAWYDELLNFLMSKGFTKGLQIHQSPRGIFINQAKYALEILKKHGMEKGQSIGTPMATKPKLDADLSGTLVDQTDYRSKIGSLKCLTSSKPNIVQAYPKDSGFELTAFLDVDHAGCIDTHKSTSGGIQFLGDKTEYQLADIFTKALPEDRFQYLVRRIGMRCLTLAELEMNEYKGIMPTKIELTLEQSQQGLSNDVLVSIEGDEELKRKVWIKGEKKEALHTTLDGNPALANIKQALGRLYGGGGIPFQLKSDSLSHAHAQTTKTYYWHQDSRIKKAQTKRQRLPQTLIYKIFL